MSKEPICHRCGKCCHRIIDGKRMKCKYLIKYPNGRTACRIYKNRINKITFENGKVFSRCGHRKDGKYDYPGCPFNTDKEMMPE